jgi:ABC-type glycerol-3-phosphate transport system substrate-binding protein
MLIYFILNILQKYENSMSIESEFLKLFHHSMIVTWDLSKEKWTAECPALKIVLESASYTELIEKMIAALQDSSPDLMTTAEELKYPYF